MTDMQTGNCSVTASYDDGDGIFDIGATSSVHLNGVSKVDQTVYLSAGWNIFSLYAEPDTINMKSVVQPLIDAGYLTKVQDETGAAIEYVVPIGWVNDIGDWRPSEGYKIKVTTNTQLDITGYPVANPYGIDLQSGWNIMSYPMATSQSALDAIDPLITRGTLVKVQNESGHAIENVIPIGWVDEILTFDPGEGYKIKVNTGDQLVLVRQTGQAYTANTSFAMNAMETRHFNTSWKGNGYDHMNVYINHAQINNTLLSAGDEIAIYDGDLCVGKSVVNNPDMPVSIIASLDDPTTTETDGFTEGHPLTFRIWEADADRELKVDVVEFAMGYKGIFEALGTTVADIKTIPDNDAAVSVGFYPNPFTEKITIDINVHEKTALRIRYYNVLGEEVYSQDVNAVAGSSTITWEGIDYSGETVKHGVYLMKLTSSDNRINKTFEIIKY